MEAKDWIQLLVPIFCNGVILFILQKIFERNFEKRQISRTIKLEYTSQLRQKVDYSLELHAKAVRFANEGSNANQNILMATLQEYVDASLDVYYYYIQNKEFFGSFEKHMDRIAELIMSLKDVKALRNNDDITQVSTTLNQVRDEMMLIKSNCIRLRL